MVSVARVLIALASLAPLVRVEAIRAEVITAAGIAPVRPRPALVAATDAALAGTGLPHLRRDLDTGAVALAWSANWPAPGSSADRISLCGSVTCVGPPSTGFRNNVKGLPVSSMIGPLANVPIRSLGP